MSGVINYPCNRHSGDAHRCAAYTRDAEKLHSIARDAIGRGHKEGWQALGCVSRNPHTSGHTLRMIFDAVRYGSFGFDDEYLRGVGANPNTPPDVLYAFRDLLAPMAGMAYELSALAQNPRCPDDLLREQWEGKVYRGSRDSVRHDVARNPGASPGLLDAIFKSGKYHDALAENPATPESILVSLAGMRHHGEAVVTNPNATPRVIQAALEAKCVDARIAVLHHAEPSLLAHMQSADKSKQVREMAGHYLRRGLISGRHAQPFLGFADGQVRITGPIRRYAEQVPAS